MKSVVDQHFGDVQSLDAMLELFFIVEDAFVQAGAGDRAGDNRFLNRALM